jgi:4-hydroxybenzoate polyprenyltransferase
MVKLGLGDSYDKTVIPPKIRAYGDITKPASSIGVMATIPFASIIYGELYHGSGIEFILANWMVMMYASATMFLLHGASQAMNMVEDAHIDRKTDHKQNRPIPSGVISEEEGRALAWLFMFLGVGRAFAISRPFGGFAILLAFFGIFYNLEPFRVKEYLWINLIWQAASRGLFLYPATFAIWGEPWNPVAWSMGVASFLLVLAMQNTADFADVDIDAEFDIITPAVYHGLNQLTLIMCGISLVMFAFIFGANHTGLLPNFWSLYILAVPIGWSLWSLWTEPNSISDLGGNHLSWYVFYLSLASMYMLPAAQLILA